MITDWKAKQDAFVSKFKIRQDEIQRLKPLAKKWLGMTQENRRIAVMSKVLAVVMASESKDKHLTLADVIQDDGGPEAKEGSCATTVPDANLELAKALLSEISKLTNAAKPSFCCFGRSKQLLRPLESLLVDVVERIDRYSFDPQATYGAVFIKHLQDNAQKIFRAAGLTKKLRRFT